MSNNTPIKTLRASLSTSATQAAPKRVRQPRTQHQFGSWWDLRYPTRAK